MIGYRSETMAGNLAWLRGRMQEMLNDCTPEQRDLFRRMYNHEGKFKRDVDSLEPQMLDHAFCQIEKTLADNRSKAGEAAK